MSSKEISAFHTPHRFPKPSSPSVRELFDFIKTRLWPKWSEKERDEFVRERRKQIVLSDRASTLTELLDQPSACSIFEEPYSAVSVSIGIAIWGVQSVKNQPTMWKFAIEHANTMASLFDSHPNGYGKSFKHLNAIRRSRASGQTSIGLKLGNGKKRLHDGSGCKISKESRQSEPNAVLNEPVTATLGNGQVDEVVADRLRKRPRRTVNYDELDTSSDIDSDCQLSHCSSECIELKAKLRAAEEQLNKTTAEMQARKKYLETSLQQAETSAQEQLTNTKTLLVALGTQAQAAREQMAKVTDERDALQNALNNQARVGEEKLAKVVSDRDTLQRQFSLAIAERDSFRNAIDHQLQAAKEQLAKVIAEKDSLQDALVNEVQSRVGKEDMDKVMSDRATVQESLNTLREKCNNSLLLSFPAVAALKLILSDHVKTQLGYESTHIAQSLLSVVNDAHVRMLVSYSTGTSQTTDSLKG